MIAYCGFDLHFPNDSDVELLFMCLLAICVIFGKTSSDPLPINCRVMQSAWGPCDLLILHIHIATLNHSLTHILESPMILPGTRQDRPS